MQRQATRGAGRPRNPELDEKIRSVTLSILVEDGYNAVTMEAVARAAGVAHTTVYRRWPSKAHLVHEILFPADEGFALEPDATLEQTLGALMLAMMASFSRPEVRAAMPGLMAEYRSDQELFDRLVKRFEPELIGVITETLGDAAARGEARREVTALTVLDSVLGFALVGSFLRTDAPPDERAAQLLDLVLHGLRPAAGRPAGDRPAGEP